MRGFAIIKSFNVLHSQYADDTQLYLSLNSVNAQSAMDECFKAVHRWFALNGRALNPDKSEAIVVGTGARRRQEGAIGSVSLGGVNIPVSECVSVWVSPWTAPCRLTAMLTTFARQRFTMFVHYDASGS